MNEPIEPVSDKPLLPAHDQADQSKVEAHGKRGGFRPGAGRKPYGWVSQFSKQSNPISGKPSGVTDQARTKTPPQVVVTRRLSETERVALESRIRAALRRMDDFQRKKIIEMAKTCMDEKDVIIIERDCKMDDVVFSDGPSLVIEIVEEMGWVKYLSERGLKVMLVCIGMMSPVMIWLKVLNAKREKNVTPKGGTESGSNP